MQLGQGVLAAPGTSAGIAAAKCRHMTVGYGAALLVAWKGAWRQAQVNPREGYAPDVPGPGSSERLSGDGVYVVMLLGDTPHDRCTSICTGRTRPARPCRA